MATQAKQVAAKIDSIRQLDLFASALADSEHDRAGLRVANEKLCASNADLRRMQLAVAEGFDALDAWTEGRLREMVEEAGDELAALVDLVLDARDEDG
jgi:hypothetical protein